jgi:hypothetical protein
MKQTVTENDFIAAFRHYDRFYYFGDYDGLRALYQYLKQLEDDTGEELELDVIALCCDFSYFADLSDYNEQYGTDYDDVYDIDELACVVDDEDGPFITYAH